MQKVMRITQKQAKPAIDRRSFFQVGAAVLSTVAAAELAAAGLLFLQARSLEGQFGGVITAGPVDSFAAGSVTEFKEGNFYLVRAADGGFLAIYRRCPHLGCTVNWAQEKEKFFCPCHASSFDAYGEFQNQLVSRALDTFPVFFEDGMVKVDTAQPQLREHHSAEQINYQK